MYCLVRQTNVYLMHFHANVFIHNHFIGEYTNRGLLITTIACLRQSIPIGTTALKSCIRMFWKILLVANLRIISNL